MASRALESAERASILSVLVTNDTESPTYTLTLKGDGISIDKKVDGAVAGAITRLVFEGVVPAGVGVGVGAGAGTGDQSPSQQTKRRASRRRATETGGEDGAPKKRRRAGGPGLVKDMTMRPAGKTSFKDFIEEKQPKNHLEKQTAIVYWLKHEAGYDEGITFDHVNTCYVEAGWRRPKELDVSMRLTANKTGWLDTGDSSNLRITTRGEDAVQHEMPRKAEK
jgi:hypothetical protein